MPELDPIRLRDRDMTADVLQFIQETISAHWTEGRSAISRLLCAQWRDASTAKAISCTACAIRCSPISASSAPAALRRSKNCLANFCREPEEQDEMITLIPEAVIEVVSKGYEAKDIEIGPRFYLSQGVKDVVVFDPYTLLVLHVRRDSVTRRVSPVQINVECGCRCTV
jgi:Putative restriction endonuclease